MELYHVKCFQEQSGGVWISKRSHLKPCVFLDSPLNCFTVASSPFPWPAHLVHGEMHALFGNKTDISELFYVFGCSCNSSWNTVFILPFHFNSGAVSEPLISFFLTQWCFLHMFKSDHGAICQESSFAWLSWWVFMLWIINISLRNLGPTGRQTWTQIVPKPLISKSSHSPVFVLRMTEFKTNSL